MGIDPVGVDENNVHSHNRYAYANNNPYRFVDPTGNIAETALDVVSLGLSIAQYNQDPSILNGIGLAYDVIGTAVPILPAGFGIIRSAGKAGASGVEAAAKRGPSTDPNAPHNAKIREIAGEIKDNGGTVLSGGGGKEKLIPTKGGYKDGRRPDILYEDANGVTRAINVGKTKANGQPVTREVKALDDLNNRAKIPTTFRRYD